MYRVRIRIPWTNGIKAHTEPVDRLSAAWAQIDLIENASMRPVAVEAIEEWIEGQWVSVTDRF